MIYLTSELQLQNIKIHERFKLRAELRISGQQNTIKNEGHIF